MRGRLPRPLVRGAVLLFGVSALAGSVAGTVSAAPARSTGKTVLRHDALRGATLKHDALTSSNWAGYAVTPLAGSPVTSFSNVFGAWTQPAVSCAPGTSSYSAFWVGLGGLTDSATSLEQIGTGADCSAAGAPVYSAWYEILPAPPVTLKLAVRPGDTVSAAVTVSGTTVSMRLRNLTRHTVVNKRLKMAAPDLSSAEWIAEAPSACTGSGRCSALSLANFGSVDFAKAAATGSGHSGLVSDPSWTPTAINLDSSSSQARGRFAGNSPSAGATASALSPTGAFSVAWQQPPATVPGA
jgi:hypothetical protein